MIRSAKLVSKMRLVSLFAILLLSFITVVDARQFGSGLDVAIVRGVPITVYTYRPTGCVKPALLFVFHGTGRTAEGYRDSARTLADKACLLVFAPLFDKERFPNWTYHRGGIVHDGNIVPRERWTVDIVSALVDWARKSEDRPDAPYYLFGHSAGGQFLSRVAAFAPPGDAERIVIANPSIYVLPSLEEPVPYGFAGLFDGSAAEEQISAYLALPITIYLGADDTGDKDLLETEVALRQGKNRFDRGKYIFREAQLSAKKNGRAFSWKLVVVPGVGHSARSMLELDQIMDAFGFAAMELAP